MLFLMLNESGNEELSCSYGLCGIHCFCLKFETRSQTAAQGGAVAQFNDGWRKTITHHRKSLQLEMDCITNGYKLNSNLKSS